LIIAQLGRLLYFDTGLKGKVQYVYGHVQAIDVGGKERLLFIATYSAEL
jgi:hypothetical protein